MKKKYIVRLTQQEIFELTDIVSQAHNPAQKRKRAQALLLANDETRSDSEIAKLVSMNNHSVTELRKRFVNKGYNVALNSAPHRRRPKAIDELSEARLLALAAQEGLEGEPKISLRGLARAFVTTDGRHVSHETIRQTLKRNELKP
jgi:transposase